MASENLRRYPRHVLRIKATVTLDTGPLEGRLENIGVGGAFFVTDTLEGSVEVGDRLVVVFELSAEPQSVPGDVLRVERYFHEGELFRAFAIRFEKQIVLPEQAEEG